LGLSVLFVVGGDGSHRLAASIAAAATQQGMQLSVACVPKTIDNDLPVIDRSFGFETAVSEAVKAVRCAKVEASCTPDGIGIVRSPARTLTHALVHNHLHVRFSPHPALPSLPIFQVRLMGRHAGFIAAYAALASGDVDLVLIPEDTQLQWRDAVDHIRRALASSNNHCVVLLAEGWTSRYEDAHASALEVLHKYQPPQPTGDASHAARDAGAQTLDCCFSF